MTRSRLPAQRGNGQELWLVYHKRTGLETSKLYQFYDGCPLPKKTGGSIPANRR